MTRRGLLRRAAGVTIAAAAGPALLSVPTYAVPGPTGNGKTEEASGDGRSGVATGTAGPNGWELEKAADAGGAVWTRPVPGTGLAGVAVRMGDVETVLVHVIRRFHYEIDQMKPGEVIGWRKPGEVRKGLAEVNQASGTAVQIRPGHYPHGARGGFHAVQTAVVRDVLAELEGVVRWGGDDSTPDESLFYLDAPPGDDRLTRVAARLRGWQEDPARGAGTHVDVQDPRRRQAAQELHTRQTKRSR
ncbi:hypothetical protein ACFCYH_12035 [Streptomyces sp. NPDC056400]|uniref:hypothetical protein n=1 Tax=Streptomyces sp. NPDC056400 TaxID=3345808 RepID=UPI0035D7BA2B